MKEANGVLNISLIPIFRFLKYLNLYEVTMTVNAYQNYVNYDLLVLRANRSTYLTVASACWLPHEVLSPLSLLSAPQNTSLVSLTDRAPATRPSPAGSPRSVSPVSRTTEVLCSLLGIPVALVTVSVLKWVRYPVTG